MAGIPSFCSRINLGAVVVLPSLSQRDGEFLTWLEFDTDELWNCGSRNEDVSPNIPRSV